MAITVSCRHDGNDPLRVLFAEDDSDTRDLYEIYFSRCGLVTEIARDGAEAVAKARALSPDVIVLDITLPRMDGFAVCRLLKREAATSAIPIIAATGYCRADTVEVAREAGFASYLLKPYAPDLLLAEIRRAADFTSRRSSPACPLRIPSLLSAGYRRSGGS